MNSRPFVAQRAWQRRASTENCERRAEKLIGKKKPSHSRTQTVRNRPDGAGRVGVLRGPCRCQGATHCAGMTLGSAFCAATGLAGSVTDASAMSAAAR